MVIGPYGVGWGCGGGRGNGQPWAVTEGNALGCRPYGDIVRCLEARMKIEGRVAGDGDPYGVG